MKPKYNNLLWGLAGSLLLASAALASVTESQQHLGAYNHQTVNYVNWLDGSGTGDTYLNLTFESNHPNVKAYEFDFSIASGGVCFEVETMDVDGPTTKNDTRMWVKVPVTQAIPLGYAGLNDDKNGSTDRYSKARVYLGGTTSMKLFSAAYSDTYNYIIFRFTATRLNKNEADCTNNSTLPWVKSKSNVITFGGGAF
jgi:hypothetical protein